MMIHVQNKLVKIMKAFKICNLPYTVTYIVFSHYKKVFMRSQKARQRRNKLNQGKAFYKRKDINLKI